MRNSCQRLAPWSWETQNGSYQSPPQVKVCKTHSCGSYAYEWLQAHSLMVVPFRHSEKNGPWPCWGTCSGRHAHPSCVMWWGDFKDEYLEATWCGWESTDFGVRLGYEYWLLHLLAQPSWKGHYPALSLSFFLKKKKKKKGGQLPTSLIIVRDVRGIRVRPCCMDVHANSIWGIRMVTVFLNFV